METDEVIKLVDNIYKNILEKFNPGARQLISTGKAYLKALHGAAAASRLFNEALAKIAVNAQQGGTTDIGAALMNIVGVYKEIQDQHMNILKAFYVDLLVPLETNLEKDTKVVQFEQKKFLQQHKLRADSYSKASATMKKQRKKKNTAANADKEIKSIQALDEEKNKLDAFCEQSLKNAMTQERRRYGFVLERQCSLAKHWIAYHTSGKNSLSSQLESWDEVSASREFLPPNVENMFAKNIREQYIDDESDRGSIISAMRKTKSIDASCLDMRSLGDVVNSSSMNMPRAKSEFNLTSSVVEIPKYDQRPVVRALYSYLASGENQLTFHEHDRIALVGDRANGWQFGENLRTQLFGWFPVAYTEMESDENAHSNWGSATNGHQNGHMKNGMQQTAIIHQSQSHHHIDHNTPEPSLDSTLIEEEDEDELSIPSKLVPFQEDHSPSRMFGDTIMYRQSKQYRRVSGGTNGNLMPNGIPKPGPPPTLPAPIPIISTSYGQTKITQSHSFSTNGGPPIVDNRKSLSNTMNYNKQSSGMKPKPRSGVTSASLHSSNDSGFANDPPPQPEIDYSDEENMTRVPIRTNHESTLKKSRIPRRTTEIDSSTMKSTKSKRSSPMRQCSSHGNLTDDHNLDFMYRRPEQTNGKVKRTKSFWKFGKSEDEILEGMALWQHRDLVQTDAEKTIERQRDATLKRFRRRSLENNTISTNSSETLVNAQNGVPNNIHDFDDVPISYPITKSDIEQRISMQEDENIYGQTEYPVIRGPPSQQNIVSRAKLVRQSYIEMDMENYEQDNIRELREQQQREQQQREQKQREQQQREQKQREQQQREQQQRDQMQREQLMQMQREQQREKLREQHKREQMREEQQRDQRMRSNNNRSKVNGQNNVKTQKPAEYYDTSEADTTLKKQRKPKHACNNQEEIVYRRSNNGVDPSFFDDDSISEQIIMKTVKRQEILKQYYSSGTDTEQNSASSSDPYDCIVVDDHLVRRENEKNKIRNGNTKMEFKTFRGNKNDNDELKLIDTTRSGTLLPRTKLSKSSMGNAKHASGCLSDGGIATKVNNEQSKRDRRSGRPAPGSSSKINRNNEYVNHTIERNSKSSSHHSLNDTNRHSTHSDKSYGPWYDLWTDSPTAHINVA